MKKKTITLRPLHFGTGISTVKMAAKFDFFSLYSVIPKLKDDFHDVFAELEKELEKDDPNFPDTSGYSDTSGDSPMEVVDSLVRVSLEFVRKRFCL